MELFYNDDLHEYRHGAINGPKLEGVTSIIAVDTKWFTEASRVEGDYVHRMTHLYDLNDLDEENLDPALQGYLTAYKKAKAEKGIEVIESEMRIHSDLYGYAGTLDKLVHIRGDHINSIIDIKSGAYSGWTELQVASYAGCFKEPLKRYGLELRPNGNYRLWEHKDRNNIQEFLTLLNAKRIREKYKL